MRILPFSDPGRRTTSGRTYCVTVTSGRPARQIINDLPLLASSTIAEKCAFASAIDRTIVGTGISTTMFSFYYDLTELGHIIPYPVGGFKSARKSGNAVETQRVDGAIYAEDSELHSYVHYAYIRGYAHALERKHNRPCILRLRCGRNILDGYRPFHAFRGRAPARYMPATVSRDSLPLHESIVAPKCKEAALVRERLLWLSDMNQNYARRRRSARPARPTSMSRPEVGSGTLTAVQAPAACEGVDCDPHLI